MSNKITDSKKSPELTSSGNLAIVPNTLPDTDPMRQLIERWLTSCMADGLATATISDYRDKVYKFWWWWSEFTHNSTKVGPHPRNVTFEEAESFAAYLRTPTMFRWGVTGHSRQTENLSAASIASYGRAVKVFFNWLKKRRILSENPFEVISFSTRKGTKLPKRVSEGDLEKLFAHLAEEGEKKDFLSLRDLAILATFVDSGIRLGELCSMKVGEGWLDLETRSCVVSGKTGPRPAVFGENCRRAIANYLDHPEAAQILPGSQLWRCEDGVPLSKSGLRSLIARLRKATGTSFSAHRLRHTFAFMMAAQGVQLYDLQRAMGHQSASTTQIYLDVDINRLQEVQKKGSPLNTLMGNGIQIKRRGRPPKER